MIIRNGIGYSEKTGGIFMAAGVTVFGTDDGAAFAIPQEIMPLLSSAPWSPWGVNNMLPYEMANHIENCGVLGASLDAKARLSIGKGLQPFLLSNVLSDGEEVLEWVSDTEVQDWLEGNDMFDVSFDLAYDRNGYGWNTGSFILNRTRKKINRIRRIDVCTARLEKRLQSPRIKNIYLCEDYTKAPVVFDGKKVVRIPLLPEGDEAKQLAKITTGYEFAFCNRKIRNNRFYYPTPLWYAAREWVKVARSIPAFKNAMFTNQITIKYIISISEKYWESAYENWGDPIAYTPEAKQKIIEDKYDEIDKWLTGTKNAFKSISSGTWYDAVLGKENPYITITVVDDQVKDGKLLPDSSAANSEILFALMMNPALIGAGQPGGPYSNNAGGSNIREGGSQQIMLLEPDRKEINGIMNVVKNFNGWSKRIEKPGTRLVFRYPAGILTTLDTGKGTKPTLS